MAAETASAVAPSRPRPPPRPPPQARRRRRRAIRKVGVLGSGVMGAGIAAHVANAGVPVVLLDIVPEGATDRNALATGALERMAKKKPAPLMSSRAAKLITPGNLEDDLRMLADCDWIVEAVVERLDVKQQVYRARRRGAQAGLDRLLEHLDDPARRSCSTACPSASRRDFLVTHFFNPPRYMRLLEVVAGPATRPDAVEAIRAFGDVRLGKSVVACKDTPAFIANRIGTFWIEVATREAIDLGLTVEEADAVAGKPMGFPKTGIFGLLDLVGIDLGPHIAASLLSTLPADDAYRDVHRDEPLLARMIESGLTGPKGKGGFYRMEKKGGAQEHAGDRPADRRVPADARGAARQPRRGEERRQGPAALRALVEHPDRGGQFAWRMLSQTLAYAASLVPAIADDIASVDEAMRTGYSWEWGPFELIDRLGPA